MQECVLFFVLRAEKRGTCREKEGEKEKQAVEFGESWRGSSQYYPWTWQFWHWYLWETVQDAMKREIDMFLTSNLITAQKRNAEGFITPNSLLLCHLSLHMFHFYLHSNKHGGNLLRYGSGRLQAATTLGYHTCCCHAWGGGGVFSDRGRKAKLIICSTALRGGTFPPAQHKPKMV